jgi:aspartyl aminopeptidase
MKSSLNQLKSYLDNSISPWHAVNELKNILFSKQFKELQENSQWDLDFKNNYFITRDSSALCAFKMPKKYPKKVNILAAHTDSPSLKIKPHGEFISHNMSLLRTELYGSPLVNTWLNKELGITGRLHYINNKEKICHSLINLDKNPLMICQLAIHLDSKLRENGLKPDPQNDLLAIQAIGKDLPEGILDSTLKKTVQAKEILSHDLFLYPLEKSSFFTQNKKLLSSARLDNLASVSACCEAFLPVESDETLSMIIFWNHEEVGSRTPQGACSPFLEEVLERISLNFSKDRNDYFILKNNTNLFSVDMAHAIHPGFEDKHDPQHPILLEQGPVIKTNAQKSYLTDSLLHAKVQSICQQNNIPLQVFSSRSDMRCGSTIGPIQGAKSGIKTLDLGIAQLSMHASKEIMSCEDYLHLVKLLSYCLSEL